MIVGTPSGVTLAPEGGAHQSIGTPLIGMSQDGLAAFEPAFADELAVIMALGLRLSAARRRGRSGRTHLAARRDRRIGLSAAVHQPDRTAGQARGRCLPARRDRRRLLAAQAGAELRSGHRLSGRRRARGDPRRGPDRREPPRCRRAGGHLGRPAECRLDGGAARAGAGQSMPHGRMSKRCWATCRAHCHLITVIDGHPATLAWLGAVCGHRTIPLGVEHFGQTGTIGDLYRHFGIDCARASSRRSLF